MHRNVRDQLLHTKPPDLAYVATRFGLRRAQRQFVCNNMLYTASSLKNKEQRRRGKAGLGESQLFRHWGTVTWESQCLYSVLLLICEGYK